VCSKSERAYRIKAANPKIPWKEVAAQVGFSLENKHPGKEALKGARLWALGNNYPWPLIQKGCQPTQKRRSSVGARAYALRKQGLTWSDINKKLGRTGCYALARMHAMSWGLDWPVPLAPDPKFQRAFEAAQRLFNTPGKLYGWSDVGRECGVSRVEAMANARNHARRNQLEVPHTRNRNQTFGESCYRIRQEGHTWVVVAKKAGMRWRTHACTAARGYALENDLPWPIENKTAP